MFGESDEWLAIENEFFVIKYHPGQGEEAEEALACAMWVRENTLEKYPHTLNLKVTITLYRDRDEIKEKEGAYTAISHVGSSRASIGILSPSWTGSWGGYEGLDHPFRRVLNHEYVHCPFYIDLYTKSRGYKDPPSWFAQGLAEYISDNYLPSYVNRIRESVEQGSFTINEPYTWGLYIVEYMYSKYGMDKVIDIIKSDEPTFNGALEEELGTTPLEFEDGWRRYVADKFGVEYSSPELENNTVVEEAPANQIGHVVDASDVAGTTVTLDTVAPVTVTIVRYEENPHPDDPMPATALAICVDVEVSDPDAVVWPIYVEMFYTDEEIEGLDEDSLGIYYWKDGAWQRCSDTGVDTERDVVWAYMTEEEASGSPILIGGTPPPPPLPPILSDLTIKPEKVERGDEVTIGFVIENIDSQSFTYIVTMKIENVNDPPLTWPPYNVTLIYLVYVEMGAYELKTIQHTITPDTVGDFNVTVDGMTGSFKVESPEPPLRPAELVLSDLSITPEEVVVWGDIDVWTFKISVNVTNVGEQEGMDTIDLRVDGSVVDWRTVKLKGGEKTMIIYDVTRGVGSYTVEVDGLTGSFTVKALPGPAEFEFSNLVITPKKVEEGLSVTISVDVTNLDEESLWTPPILVALKLDGVVVDSEEIPPFSGGVTATQYFEVTRGEGTYEVEIEGLTGVFTVKTKLSFWDKIPRFPYESIILGLIAVIIILWYARAHKL